MSAPEPYPAWVRARLQSMYARPPRYENSYYGPIDAILNSIFPASRRFLTKPHAILRPSYPTEASVYLPPGSQPHSQASRSSSRIAIVTANQPAAPSHRYKLSVDSQGSVDSMGDTMLARKKGGWEESLFIPDFLVVKGTGM